MKQMLNEKDLIFSFFVLFNMNDDDNDYFTRPDIKMEKSNYSTAAV